MQEGGTAAALQSHSELKSNYEKLKAITNYQLRITTEKTKYEL
jgi:hypothetical protein